MKQARAQRDPAAGNPLGGESTQRTRRNFLTLGLLAGGSVLALLAVRKAQAKGQIEPSASSAVIPADQIDKKTETSPPQEKTYPRGDCLWWSEKY